MKIYEKRLLECLNTTDIYTESSLLAAKQITESRITDKSRLNPQNVLINRYSKKSKIEIFKGIRFLEHEDETLMENAERKILEFLSFINSFLPEKMFQIGFFLKKMQTVNI